MAKYNNEFYIQLPRKIFNDERYRDLSINAKWVYVVLNELEHRFSEYSKSDDLFYRTDEKLADDCGLSLKTFKRAKAELKNTDLLDIVKVHFITEDENGNKKRSKRYATGYRIK